jgi:outer membrane protein TolC
MLPQLTLTGAYGGEALDFGKLLSPGSGTWNIAAGITAPLFQGGTLRAKRRAAFDTYDQVSAQYRMVVLQAFANVADSLTALDNDAQALRAEYEAVNAAKDGLTLIERQFDDGAVSSVSLLTAQQIFQQTRIAYSRAIASRYADSVLLFQALGGGWWNRRDQGTLQVAGTDYASSSTRN